MSHSIENGPGDVSDGGEFRKEIDSRSQFQRKESTSRLQVQPNHPLTAQIPQLIMKLNSASCLFEKTQYFRSQRDLGFIFFTLLSVSRG